MNGSVIVDKWQINWYDILWMHVCVFLAIIVCWCCSSACRSSRTLLFFSPRMICCYCVSVCACVHFLFSSPRCLHRSWETRPRQHWARSHHPPPVLHWLRDILISGMLHKKWLHDNQSGLKSLFEPTYLLSIDSLNQFLELQRPIWTHSAQWTGRGLSKDTHLFPTYRRFVLGQRAHHCMSPHERQRSSFEKGLIIFVWSSLCVYF